MAPKLSDALHFIKSRGSISWAIGAKHQHCSNERQEAAAGKGFVHLISLLFRGNSVLDGKHQEVTLEKDGMGPVLGEGRVYSPWDSAVGDGVLAVKGHFLQPPQAPEKEGPFLQSPWPGPDPGVP